METNQRILLVEDDHRLAKLIKDYLQQQGFEVLIENRGDTALGRVFNENPDLIILDLMFLEWMDCRYVRIYDPITLGRF